MADPNRPGDGRTHGASTVTPVGQTGGGAPPPSKPPEKRKNWLPWLLIPLALLALLFLMRSCGDRDEIDTSVSTLDAPAVAPGSAPPAAAPAVPAAAPLAGDLNTRLQQYLASAEPAGRRFTFDDLHFATSSSDLPGNAGDTLQAVAQTLAQYPNARVRIEGYADARGSDGANAQLGARRAETVARALIGSGVAAGRITSASGSESNPVDTNATPQGQAQNRRTDMVVTAK